MFNKYINILILTSLALSTLNSCVDLVEGQDEGMGYLSLSELSAEVEVYELVPTRSGTSSLSALVGEYNQPDISKVSFTLKGTDYSKTWTGALTEDIALSAGIYTLSAVYNNGDYDGFEEALYGQSSQAISISSFNTTIPTVKLPLANSLVAVTMADGFDNHFTPDEGTPVTISNTSGSVSVSVAMDAYVFVPSDEKLTVIVAGKSSAGIPKQYKCEVAPSAKNAYDVVLSATGVTMPTINFSAEQIAWGDRIYITKPATFSENISNDNKAKLVYEAIPSTSSDWTNPITASDGVIKGLTAGTTYKVRARVGNLSSEIITLTPSVTGLSSSAGHTKTGNDLDGTDVTTTFTSPAQIVEDDISGWKFQLYKSDGTEPLREYTDADGSTTSDGSIITDRWPYLPQGAYKLKATATFNDGSTVSSMESIEVGAPDFSVTVSGYTTYDKYLEYTNTGKSDALSSANAEGKAEYIFQISTSVGISEALLKNSNYTTKVYYTCGPYTNVEYSFVNGEGDINTSVKVHNIGDVGGFSWGENTLTSKVSFAGTEISNSRTCYITGLPYTAAPPKNSGDHPWIDSKGSNTWNSDCVKLYYSAGKYPRITSPTFYIPQDINVNVSTKIYREYYWSSVARGPIKVYQYNSTSGSEKSIYDARLSREETLETTWGVSMSNTYNAYYIEYEYMADTGKTNVYYFNVYYR